MGSWGFLGLVLRPWWWGDVGRRAGESEIRRGQGGPLSFEMIGGLAELPMGGVKNAG